MQEVHFGEYFRKYMYGKKCITKTKYEMMTNLLYGLVEQEVHCQTNRGPKIQILEKVHLPSLCTNLSFPMEPKEKSCNRL